MEQGIPLVFSHDPICAPIPSAVSVLVEAALSGKLSICFGAGLSVAAGLPDGPSLATKLDEDLRLHIEGYECDKPDDLVAVASSGASLPSGLKVVQTKVLKHAPFRTARPTLAHQLLALLFAEGMFRLLTTNWDNCLERGCEERIDAAADGVEAEQYNGSQLLKIHGCCTRPATLLLTAEQLAEPPFWTKQKVQAEALTSTIVFIGVGDVAPYVREPIEELVQRAGDVKVHIVSRRIVDRWDDSCWRDVVPNLPEENRLQLDADGFVAQLARGWLHDLLEHLMTPPQSAGVRAAFTAFGHLAPLDALQWLRRSAAGWVVGESVVRTGAASEALRAVGFLAERQRGSNDLSSARNIKFSPNAAVTIEGEQVEVLLAKPRQSAAELMRLARDRFVASSTTEVVKSRSVLCAAEWIRGTRPPVGQIRDIFEDTIGPVDVFEGGTQSTFPLYWADKLIEAA